MALMMMFPFAVMVILAPPMQLIILQLAYAKPRLNLVQPLALNHAT
jgi:hypothetical protein